jgi:hypothetical protein
MEQKKKQVYSELLDLLGNNQTIIKKEEIAGLFTQSLTIQPDANSVILCNKFNELQEYGNKLSILKNLLHEQTEYWKVIFDIAKDKFKKSDCNDNIDYEDKYGTYSAWRYFYELIKDKWELLDRAIGQIRSSISTEREMIKYNISAGK